MRTFVRLLTVLSMVVVVLLTVTPAAAQDPCEVRQAGNSPVTQETCRLAEGTDTEGFEFEVRTTNNGQIRVQHTTMDSRSDAVGVDWTVKTMLLYDDRSGPTVDNHVGTGLYWRDETGNPGREQACHYHSRLTEDAYVQHENGRNCP
jgi:hypothetical protein